METTVTFYPKLYLRSFKENAIGFRSIRNNPPARTDITKAIIPDGALMLCDKLFKSCKSLTDIEIPESVDYINDQVFMDCISLKEIRLPHSMQKIGKEAFKNCLALESIRIPRGITNIKDFPKTFNNCPSLKHIELPQELQADIPDGLFDESIELKFY